MGPNRHANRMWMFPVGFTTRRTNDVPQQEQRELSVKSSFHRLHGPGASALSLQIRHTRGTRGAVPPMCLTPGRWRGPAAGGHVFIYNKTPTVRVWSVSVSDVGFCLFAFPPSELSNSSPSSGIQCE
jgi:hypothetical protein